MLLVAGNSIKLFVQLLLGRVNTKIHWNGFWCKHFRRCMEIETDHAVVSHCCCEGENRRTEVFSVPVYNWRKIKIDFQYMGMGEEKCCRISNVMVISQCYYWWKYCLVKKNFVIEIRKFFTRNHLPDETTDAFITELRNLS